MRIGVDGISFAFAATGVTRYLTSMLREMVQMATQDEFFIYSPVPIEVPLDKGNWHLRVVPSLFSRRPSLWTQFILPQVLAEDNIDVFWAQPTNLPLKLKRRALRILTLHDLVPYVYPGSMQLRALLRTRLLLPRVVRAADIVVCVSDSTAQEARNYFKIKEEKLRVVKEGASSIFQPVDKEAAKEIVSQEFGITGDYIIFVSTIEPRKDHRTLFRALSELTAPPLLVLVGGIGWRCRAILKEIKEFEKKGIVRYLGRVADRYLPALYSAAQLSLYPSRYEGFGLPVLEAMACGCPVLCSDIPSLTEVGGESAEYFRVGDYQDLKDKLKEILGNEQLREEIVQRGLSRAKEFSFTKAAQQLLNIIKKAQIS
ncbi:MAG: glycosyltransferase family 1 protein [candidate division WOR-3 bacterium]